MRRGHPGRQVPSRGRGRTTPRGKKYLRAARGPRDSSASRFLPPAKQLLFAWLRGLDRDSPRHQRGGQLIEHVRAKADHRRMHMVEVYFTGM